MSRILPWLLRLEPTTATILHRFRGITETPERYRISQRLDLRNTMFPFKPRRSAEKVDRSRVEDKRVTLPSRERLSAKSENTNGTQRYADHVLEDVPVPVPAYGRPGRVFCN